MKYRASAGNNAENKVIPAFDFVVALGLGAGFLATYCFFAPPGLIAGDSAELTYGMKNFQSVHSPGYPLYLAIGYIILNWLPVPVLPGAHWISGFYSSLALVVLYAFFRSRNLNYWVAGLGCVFFGLCYPIWKVSIQAEVYSLSLLLFALGLLTWSVTRNRELPLGWLWFVVGLSLTHHPMGIFTVILAIHATSRSATNLRLTHLILFLLPISSYLLLLKTGSGFPFNWSQIGSLQSLVRRMLSGDFVRFFMANGLLTPLYQLQKIVFVHLAAFPGMLIVLACVGYVIVDEESRVLILLQGLILAISCVYGVPDIQQFLVQSYAISAIFMAIGLQWTIFYFRKYAQMATVAGALASILAFMYWVPVTYNLRSHTFPERYVESASETVRTGTVFSDWSHYTLLRYHQLTSDEIQGVQLISPTHQFDRWPNVISEHLSAGPVYVTTKNWSVPLSMSLRKDGFVYRVER